DFLSGMLNKRVGQTVLKLIGKKLSDTVDSLNSSDLKKAASVIKGMSFETVGSRGFENSQVTAGGIDTNEFDSGNMMSKRDAGLFAVGEILDVDGDCGGFNLHWAWSSSLCAAEGIAEYLGLELC
ncbi:MAG: NAD(P)/FAD-dependent oxidoreductase, partial [Clostridia bacterium]|nr:NAD(P)/FAD-dependent oxidoreductase [Clostridia bacterium]